MAEIINFIRNAEQTLGVTPRNLNTMSNEDLSEYNEFLSAK
jgi:hypothetical protein